jgi:hypothetical protein
MIEHSSTGPELEVVIVSPFFSYFLLACSGSSCNMFDNIRNISFDLNCK